MNEDHDKPTSPVSDVFAAMAEESTIASHGGARGYLTITEYLAMTGGMGALAQHESNKRPEISEPTSSIEACVWTDAKGWYSSVIAKEIDLLADRFLSGPIQNESQHVGKRNADGDVVTITVVTLKAVQ